MEIVLIQHNQIVFHFNKCPLVLSGSQSQYKNILGGIIMNNLEHDVTRLEVYIINSLKICL